jgi:hypothetical protein
VWWSVRRPHLTQWAARHRRPRPEALAVAVEVLALLCRVPRAERPLPGAPSLAHFPAGALVHDARTADRIDALLARAAGTDYPAEARACAAKAQHLMVRHAARPTAGAGSAMGAVLRLVRRVASTVVRTAPRVAGELEGAAHPAAAQPEATHTAAAQVR